MLDYVCHLSRQKLWKGYLQEKSKLTSVQTVRLHGTHIERAYGDWSVDNDLTKVTIIMFRQCPNLTTFTIEGWGYIKAGFLSQPAIQESLQKVEIMVKCHSIVNFFLIAESTEDCWHHCS